MDDVGGAHVPPVADHVFAVAVDVAEMELHPARMGAATKCRSAGVWFAARSGEALADEGLALLELGEACLPLFVPLLEEAAARVPELELEPEVVRSSGLWPLLAGSSSMRGG